MQKTTITNSRPRTCSSLEFLNPYSTSDSEAVPRSDANLFNSEIAQAPDLKSTTVKRNGVEATFTKDNNGHSTEDYKINGQEVKKKDVQMHLLSGAGLSTVVESYNLPNGQFRQTTRPGIPSVQESNTRDEFLYKGHAVRVTTGDRYDPILGANFHSGPTFERYNLSTQKYEPYSPTKAEQDQVTLRDQQLQKEANQLDQKLNKIPNPLDNPPSSAA